MQSWCTLRSYLAGGTLWPQRSPILLQSDQQLLFLQYRMACWNLMLVGKAQMAKKYKNHHHVIYHVGTVWSRAWQLKNKSHWQVHRAFILVGPISSSSDMFGQLNASNSSTVNYMYFKYRYCTITFLVTGIVRVSYMMTDSRFETRQDGSKLWVL